MLGTRLRRAKKMEENKIVVLRTSYSNYTKGLSITFSALGVLICILLFICNDCTISSALLLCSVFIFCILQLTWIPELILEYYVKKYFCIELHGNDVTVKDSVKKLYFKYNEIQHFNIKDIYKIETLKKREYRLNDKGFLENRLHGFTAWFPKLKNKVSYSHLGLTHIITLKNKEIVFIRYYYLLNKEAKDIYKQRIAITR